MQTTRAVSTPVLILFFSLTVIGCGRYMYAKEMEDNNRSLVFGYIDAKDAKMLINGVFFVPDQPGRDKDYIETRVISLDTEDYDDTFYLENMKRGSYRLDSIAGIWYSTGIRSYFPKSGPGARTFKIDKPGLHFVGAYKYNLIRTGWTTRKFELVPLTSPTEKEILQKVLPFTEGTKWDPLIRKRIREL